VTLLQNLTACALAHAARAHLPGDRGRAVAVLVLLLFWTFARIVDGAWFAWAKAPGDTGDSDDGDFS